VALPTNAGEALTEGLLYRFIPNLEVYWEYDCDRPSPRVFRQRPNETDVSMYLEGLTTVARLQQLKLDFGIYSVQVERLCAFGGMSIKYDPDLTQPEGVAKVAVTGINRRRAEHIAREIGERVHTPAAAVDNLSSEVDDPPAAGPAEAGQQ
jgi:hypothetical protein